MIVSYGRVAILLPLFDSEDKGRKIEFQQPIPYQPNLILFLLIVKIVKYNDFSNKVPVQSLHCPFHSPFDFFTLPTHFPLDN